MQERGHVLVEVWHACAEELPLWYRVAREEPYANKLDFDGAIWHVDPTPAFIDCEFLKLHFAFRNVTPFMKMRPPLKSWRCAALLRPRTAFESALWEALDRFMHRHVRKV